MTCSAIMATMPCVWRANILPGMPQGLPGAAQLRDIANNSTDAGAVFAAVDAFFTALGNSEAA